MSILVISYLFFGGAGSGALAVLIVLDFLTPAAAKGVVAKGRMHTLYAPQKEYRSFFAPGFILATAVLVLAVLCLLFDLGRPDRALSLFLSPTASYISVGTYVLALAIACGLILAILWSVPLSRFAHPLVRCIQGVGLVAALATMLYTGLLLVSIGEGILLGNVMIPVLFVLSALSCGIALLFLMGGVTQAGEHFFATFKRLALVDTLLIVLEAIALAIFFGLAFTSADSASSAFLLINGSLAPVFWLGVALVGLILPCIFEILIRRNHQQLCVATGISVLVGGFALRWCIVLSELPLVSSGVM